MMLERRWLQRALVALLILTIVPLAPLVSAHPNGPARPTEFIFLGEDTPGAFHAALQGDDTDVTLPDDSPDDPVAPTDDLPEFDELPNGTPAPDSEAPEVVLSDVSLAETPAPNEGTPVPTPIASPSVTLDRTRATPGSSIGYLLRDFPANTAVYVGWQNPLGDLHEWGTVQTDSNGSATGSFTVPAAPANVSHAVQFRTVGGDTVTAPFEIAPLIKPSVTTVKPFDVFQIQLSGFAANDLVSLFWKHPSGAWVIIDQVTTNVGGNVVSVTVETPEWIQEGVQTIRAEGIVKQNSSAITALGPKVTLDRTRATTGTTINYELTGFPANRMIAVSWQLPNGNIQAWGSIQTNTAGSFSGSFEVPAAPGDIDHEVRFTFENEVITAPFEIAPRIRSTVEVVRPGEQFAVNLRGFSARDTLTLLWKNPAGAWIQIGEVTTSASGSVTTHPIVTPDWVQSGTQTLRAQGKISQNTSAIEAVSPSESVTPTRTTVNNTVYITVSNYPPNTTVSVTLGRSSGTVDLGSFQTDSNGNGTHDSRLPAMQGGDDLTLRFTTLRFTRTLPFQLAARVKSNTYPGVRGGQVDISLRGFAKQQPVTIRWRNPATNQWVVVGTGRTSNTGSANIWVTVPSWAPTGNNSVRAETPAGNAQTNVVPIAG